MARHCTFSIYSKSNRRNAFSVPVSLKKAKVNRKEYAIIQSASAQEEVKLQCFVKRANPLPKIVWKYTPFRLDCNSNDPGSGWTSDFVKVISVMQSFFFIKTDFIGI